MKPKQITIKDVAKAAGVSVATVSRALNGLGGIGDETRERVLQVCEEMAYVPNSLARGLIQQNAKMIGIVVPDVIDACYSRLMVMAAEEARKYGCQVLFCDSCRDYELERDYFRLLIGIRVEGILFIPVGEESAKGLYQFMRYVPLLSLYEMPEGSEIPFVCADERKGGCMAAEFLIGCGCRRLLLADMTEERVSCRCREEGFFRAAEKGKVWAKVLRSGGRTSFERGYQEFSRYMKDHDIMPDGVAVVGEAAAEGVKKACREQGISVPDQLQVIGFGNIWDGRVKEEAGPGTVMVSVSRGLQVKRAVNLLIHMKQGQRISKEQQKNYIEPEIIRGS